MGTQRLWMAWMSAHVRERRPDFVVCSQAWDETGERLALRMLTDRNTTLSQQASVWQVLVSRFRFVFGWIQEDGTVQSVCFDPIVPPVPVISVAARHLCAALDFHPAMQDVHAFRKVLVDHSTLVFDCHEADGATANDTYHAWKQHNPIAPHATCNLLLCGNHSNALLEGQVVTVGGNFNNIKLPLLQDLYAMSLFLKMGGNFVRLLANMNKLVRSIRVTAKPPPPGAADFAAEMTAFLLQAYKNQKDPSELALSKYTATLQRNERNKKTKENAKGKKDEGDTRGQLTDKPAMEETKNRKKRPRSWSFSPCSMVCRVWGWCITRRAASFWPIFNGEQPAASVVLSCATSLANRPWGSGRRRRFVFLTPGIF